MKENGPAILVAVDGSLPSENAVRYGARLAKTLGARVSLFHVMESDKIGYWLFIDRHFHKELEKAAQQVIEAAEKILQAAGVAYTVETKEGTQAVYLEIVHKIETTPGVVALVMGDRGVCLREHHILGSTTERVIREVAKRALPVAVTIVPEKLALDAAL
jgi:nucleotide-binding universal stress UspA family protein